MGHAAGGQPGGWGLAAWNGLADAKRNGSSTKVAVHDGEDWPMDWVFTRVE